MGGQRHLPTELRVRAEAVECESLSACSTQKRIGDDADERIRNQVVETVSERKIALRNAIECGVVSEVKMDTAVPK